MILLLKSTLRSALFAEIVVKLSNGRSQNCYSCERM